MDWLFFAIPVFLLATAYSLALWVVPRPSPGGPGFIKLHAVAGSALLGLALIVALYMASIRALDLSVDDASVLVMVLFAGLGVVLCLVLAPLARYFMRRGPAGPKAPYTINTFVCLPYVIILMVLLICRG